MRHLLPVHTVLRQATSPPPRVSVVIPVYKVRATLREAVDSVLLQRWRDLEALVIDDASPDDDTQVLSDIDDPRLTIVRLHRNAGLSGARNAGMALARGEYIALLDGDDVSLPTRIGRQVMVLERRPKVGLVGCLTNRIDTEGRLLVPGQDYWRLSDAALKPMMLFANPFSAVYMLRRSAIPPEGFPPRYAEDYALAAEVARTHEVALLREPLVNYRISPRGIMQSRLEMVTRDASVTQCRLLAEVGLCEQEHDPELMGALLHFARQPAGAFSFPRLLALKRWMDSVERANGTSRRYDPEHLRQAVARAWEILLLHATKIERLPAGPRYLGQLWSYRIADGRPVVRAKALAHGVINGFRREAFVNVTRN
ncbi:MAG TPA: glycosyltransferase family A protein [Burkholderiaceae bacterium]|nr:glycosyltransferase family A protein [Burkholderiaceae bacterium]